MVSKLFRLSLPETFQYISTHTFICHRIYTNVEGEEKNNDARKMKLDKALKEKTLNTEIFHRIKNISPP